jgi:glutamine amidotransferase
MMCRLILARGAGLDVGAVLRAALGMSTGGTADHENPITRHPNGWGAVWRQPDGWRVHRDRRSMAESWHTAPMTGVRADVLAVHVRHATLSHTLGEEYSHPLQRPGEPWFFMHNGFLPTVHRQLGLPASRFDSAEYFDYLIPRGSAGLVPDEALTRVRAIAPGGSSGNAIAISDRSAYVVHWTPPGTAYPRYFTMHRFRRPGLDVIASEVVPALGAAASWTPLPPAHVLDIPHPTRVLAKGAVT